MTVNNENILNWKWSLLLQRFGKLEVCAIGRDQWFPAHFEVQWNGQCIGYGDTCAAAIDEALAYNRPMEAIPCSPT